MQLLGGGLCRMERPGHTEAATAFKLVPFYSLISELQSCRAAMPVPASSLAHKVGAVRS